ncbi:MAG: hypothetical protein P8I44_06055 [Phycisphaerales bacterium]|nr:hypothetical protein [Phycisphaerales bacterium]
MTTMITTFTTFTANATSIRILPLVAAAIFTLGCEPAAEQSSSPPAGGSAPVANADPWGAMPTEVEPFYFTDFETWLGKPLADQDLARLITRPSPEALKTGRGFVMFYRTDCGHCHHMLEQWFTASVPAPTVAVQVPDTDPANAMPFPSTIVEKRALPSGPDYVISTPALFAIRDGVVTGFALAGALSDAAVEACLASNAD